MEKVTLDGFLTEFGGVRNGWFHRNEYHKRDEHFLENLDHFIDVHNGIDVYYCVYNYESDDIDNCRLLGSPYLDFDGALDTEEDYEVVRTEVRMVANYFETYWGIPTSMIEIYFSGNKGFHLIIPYQILGLKPDAELNVKNKLLAHLVQKQCRCTHIDMGIYDRKRLFRIPGTINSKSGLYKVPLTYAQLTSFSLGEVKEWASEPRDFILDDPQFIKKSAEHYKQLFKKKLPKPKRKKEPSKIPSKRKPLLPCVVKILKEGVQQGSRNNTTVALASSLMQSGITRKEVEDIILDWNCSNEPPLSDTEIAITVSSAYRRLSDGKTYGCASFKELGYCVGNTCKLTKK